MLWVYAGLNLVECDKQARSELPKGYTDLSKTPLNELSKELETVVSHFHDAFIYLGYVDPLLMMNPQHDTRCRPAFRKCTVSMVVSNPLLLPFSWKNGTERLTVVGTTKQDVNSSTIINNSSSTHVLNEVGHGRDAPKHAPRKRNNKNRKEGNTKTG